MDYFYDAFTTFLGPESGSCVGCQWRGKNIKASIKAIKLILWCLIIRLIME